MKTVLYSIKFYILCFLVILTAIFNCKKCFDKLKLYL